MSLKINGYRKILKIATLALIVGVVGMFFVKVMIFEASYYDEKEGSEREELVLVEEEEPLEEEEPTAEEVKEYVVAPDRPRYLSISKLGISKARVISVGVKTNGEVGTPNNVFDVGWYEASSKPGSGGTMLIVGHNGGPNVFGVFKTLPNLSRGDLITVERGDGCIFEYEVVDNEAVSLAEANNGYMGLALRSPIEGEESITLISCTGEWSQAKRTYLSRQFTRAVLVGVKTS
ncbi:MAG: class F sortase [Candidatus Saccharibacteria bacterium]|nr:class F sortase [Candidatus Saccharibacteria bacterium]